MRHDWRRWGIPGTDTYKDAAFLNAFEYVSDRDVRAQVSRLLDQGVTLWVAYHCAEDRPEGVGEAAGWQSALTRQDWAGLAEAKNTKVTPAWAFDGFQSFLKIQPRK